MERDLRKCQECEKPIFGRADKKFCSDACRSAFNNRANASSTNYMRNVNNILGRNRRILKELNPGGGYETHRDQLLRKGFDFDFYTNSYTNRGGEIYRFCYEQGYLMRENGYILIIERDEE